MKVIAEVIEGSPLDSFQSLCMGLSQSTMPEWKGIFQYSSNNCNVEVE